jgi:hypothetical protein
MSRRIVLPPDDDRAFPADAVSIDISTYSLPFLISLLVTVVAFGGYGLWKRWHRRSGVLMTLKPPERAGVHTSSQLLGMGAAGNVHKHYIGDAIVVQVQCPVRVAGDVVSLFPSTVCDDSGKRYASVVCACMHN